LEVAGAVPLAGVEHGRRVTVTLSGLSWIPDGDAGTYSTLARMAQVVNLGQINPLTVDAAHRIVSGCRPRDSGCYAYTIRAWLARWFRFVPDALDVETLRTPDYLLQELATRGAMTGDCDDAAVLGAALGKAVGLPARFVVLGFASAGDAFGHVYAQLQTQAGNWVSLDVTKPRGPLEPPSRTLAYDI
jgi:transglutaminase-like putative cysteine protease